MALKKLVLAAVWVVAVLCWAGLFAFYFVGEPSTQSWALAVGGSAVATEVAFWTTAAVFGLSLWESRKKVIGWLARPFRRR